MYVGSYIVNNYYNYVRTIASYVCTHNQSPLHMTSSPVAMHLSYMQTFYI